MRVLVDTNILARLAQPAHPHHPIALNALDALHRRGHNLVIVPQVLQEFWVICTRPEAVNGLGMQVAVASEKMLQAEALFGFLADTQAVFPIWKRLIRDLSVMGKHAHDARLVASMIVHSVPAILTFDAAEFARYAEVKILDP